MEFDRSLQMLQGCVLTAANLGDNEFILRICKVFGKFQDDVNRVKLAMCVWLHSSFCQEDAIKDHPYFSPISNLFNDVVLSSHLVVGLIRRPEMESRRHDFLLCLNHLSPSVVCRIIDNDFFRDSMKSIQLMATVIRFQRLQGNVSIELINRILEDLIRQHRNTTPPIQSVLETLFLTLITVDKTILGKIVKTTEDLDDLFPPIETSIPCNEEEEDAITAQLMDHFAETSKQLSVNSWAEAFEMSTSYLYQDEYLEFWPFEGEDRPSTLQNLIGHYAYQLHAELDPKKYNLAVEVLSHLANKFERENELRLDERSETEILEMLLLQTEEETSSWRKSKIYHHLIVEKTDETIRSSKAAEVLLTSVEFYATPEMFRSLFNYLVENQVELCLNMKMLVLQCFNILPLPEKILALERYMTSFGFKDKPLMTDFCDKFTEFLNRSRSEGNEMEEDDEDEEEEEEEEEDDVSSHHIALNLVIQSPEDSIRRLLSEAFKDGAKVPFVVKILKLTYVVCGYLVDGQWSFVCRELYQASLTTDQTSQYYANVRAVTVSLLEKNSGLARELIRSYINPCLYSLNFREWIKAHRLLDFISIALQSYNSEDVLVEQITTSFLLIDRYLQSLTLTSMVSILREVVLDTLFILSKKKDLTALLRKSEYFYPIESDKGQLDLLFEIRRRYFHELKPFIFKVESTAKLKTIFVQTLPRLLPKEWTILFQDVTITDVDESSKIKLALEVVNDVFSLDRDHVILKCLSRETSKAVARNPMLALEIHDIVSATTEKYPRAFETCQISTFSALLDTNNDETVLKNALAHLYLLPKNENVRSICAKKAQSVLLNDSKSRNALLSELLSAAIQ